MINVARILVGLVFVIAGAMKAWNPQAFQAAIDGYRLLPTFGTALVALYLPWLEMVAGLLLLSGRPGWRAALAIIISLTVVFLMAIAQAVVRGLDPDCGCLGSIGSSLHATIARDVLILALAVWVWRRTGQGPRPSTPIIATTQVLA